MYHVLIYIECCETKIKKFNSESELNKFALEFLTKSYNNPDNWIDMVITNIAGEVVKYGPG